MTSQLAEYPAGQTYKRDWLHRSSVFIHMDEK